jgi:hypothetical protein
MFYSRVFNFRQVAAAVLVAAVSSASAEQLIFSDTFDVSGGFSPGNTFTNNGVNYEIGSRLTGAAFDSNPGLRLLRTGTEKAGSAYSIANNQLVVNDVAGVGSFQYSADGTAGFNFGSFLAGQTYEIKLTLTLGETEDLSRRASFYLADALGSNVTNSAVGFQIASNAVSGGTESAYRRIRATSSPTGSAINESVLGGLDYNAPVEFRLVVTDSTDYTDGVFASLYDLYVNGVLASSGNFRFANDNRYLVFDVAPNSGPASFDNFSVTLVPEPSTLALGFVGFVGSLAAWVRRSSSRHGGARRLTASGDVCDEGKI